MVLADPSASTDTAEKPLFNTYASIHKRNAGRKKHGERYTGTEIDIITYEFLSSGLSFQEFKKNNLCYASKRTILRHIHKETETVREGKLNSSNIYLFSNYN